MRSAWLSAAVLPLVLMAALGGCTQRATPPVEQLDEKPLVDGSAYMVRRYMRWMESSAGPRGPRVGLNERMPVDLTDATQYRFVLNRLQAAGVTAQDSPNLFHRLSALHAPRSASQHPEVVAAAGVKAAETATPSDWCGHLIPLGGVGGDAGRTHFEGSALASCLNGADYGFVDVSAYATQEGRKEFELLAHESYEEYAGTVLETPSVRVSLKRGSKRQLLVDSLFLSFDDRTGRQFVSYVAVRASSMGGGGGLHLEHPRDLGDDLPHEQGTVRLCLERGSMHGFLDCDYGAVRAEPDGGFTPFLSTGNTGIAAIDAEASRATMEDGGTRTWIADPSAYWVPPPPQVFDPTRFQVPMRGTFVTGEGGDCEVTYRDAWVVALLEESGGVCVGGQVPGSTVGLKEGLPWTTPTRPGEYPFNGIVDFGVENCLQQNQNIRLQIWVFAGGKCNVGGNQIDFYCPAKKEVTPMDYKRICLAEGTRVLAEDGSQVLVEQVKVGDKLLSSASGRVLTVTTVSRGGESKPLVKLKDEAGHEVMMTETHPVVTVARGVVQAGEVAPGDKVLTRDGPRKLVAVERVPHDGMVYNMALGTEEELAQAGGPEARTLFANGFLVGDSYLQSELEKARRTDTREVLARLHQNWHRDFRLHRTKRETARR